MAVFSTIGDIFRTAAPWISVGANLLATVKQFESAKAIERQGAFNRGVFEAEGAAIWENYEDRAAILQAQQRRLRGEQAAAYAKSGVTLAGSPALVMAETLYLQELDQSAMYRQAVADRQSALNKGALAEWEAQQQGAAVRADAYGGIARVAAQGVDLLFPREAPA
ncbi:MAG: hypothetical protein KDI23_04360 [Pseudomonadales bacterium]|nr:hypothetical protein [Pseudomonadales bacterium]